MSRKIGILFIVLGILALLAALGLVFYNNWESQSAMESSASVLTVMRQQEQQEEQSRAQSPSGESLPEDPYADHVDTFDEAAKEMTVKEIDGYDYIGYLTVPVLELELPVMSEWDYDRLRMAPCRQFGSTKTDDLVIAAHNYPTHFGRFSQLRADDLLTFTDMDGEVILYCVVGVEVIAPTAVEAVKNSGFDLVLYTCTFGGENRIAVFCDRVEL